MHPTPLILLFVGLSLAANYSIPEKQKNSHFYTERFTTASPEEVWQIWMDVARWKEWDIGLKDAAMTENMLLGSEGTVLTLQDKTVAFEVTAFEEGKFFQYKVKLPLGNFTVDHLVEQRDEQTYFVHVVRFGGFSGGLFSTFLGKEFREQLPIAMDKLKTIAEQK